MWHKGKTLLRKGVIPPAAASATQGAVEILAIVQKALTQAPDPDGLSQPTYIPDLQVRLLFRRYWPVGHAAVLLLLLLPKPQPTNPPREHTRCKPPQVLPGRVEFINYLPMLCQAVVLQPFDNNQGLVILGGNRKRDLTPKDLAQARVVAQKVQSCLLQG